MLSLKVVRWVYYNYPLEIGKMILLYESVFVINITKTQKLIIHFVLVIFMEYIIRTLQQQVVGELKNSVGFSSVSKQNMNNSGQTFKLVLPCLLCVTTT